MRKTRLDKLIQFTLGKNPTRITVDNQDIYSPEDFESDLHCRNTEFEENSCVINLMKSKASPLSSVNTSKCLTSNFLKCEFDGKVIDPWYLCFKFNEDKGIEQQISKYHQGSTLSVKKLNVKIIGELEIDLVDFEKQRVIGEIYKETIMQHDRMLIQADNQKKLFMAMITKIEED
ncbi:hypothetical protein [Eubacterium xylanophilum]|uniref:hypothetical protein n=1 Tax=Eubacterium xylanophilum TaxID=39497 RepID=UPI0004787C4A|nr:hypothetical protein [Eubacterium xylanophilum]